jgi:hypothetical protein
MRTKLNYKLVICLMTALSISLLALAQDEKAADATAGSGIDGIAWGMGLLLLFIFLASPT